MKFILTILLTLYVGYQLTKYICFTEYRMLSDRELIEPDLKVGLESGEALTHSWDNTVDSYLKYHPDCCTVSRNILMNTLRYGVFSDIGIVMSLEYELSEHSKKEMKATHYIFIAYKDACGKAFRYTSLAE